METHVDSSPASSSQEDESSSGYREAWEAWCSQPPELTNRSTCMQSSAGAVRRDSPFCISCNTRYRWLWCQHVCDRQNQELCKEFPKPIKRSMQEASCSVSFRFGNDSTVVGRRAVYFPVGSKWIKVVIVPTNTPFLIANSVFRS